MVEYSTISMNLAELVAILIEAGKLPRNKQVKISISWPGTGQYHSYPQQEVINFELFEPVVFIDKTKLSDL